MMLYFVMHYRDPLLPEELSLDACEDTPHLLVALDSKTHKYALVQCYSDIRQATKHYNKLVKERTRS